MNTLSPSAQLSFAVYTLPQSLYSISVLQQFRLIAMCCGFE